jgi:predicted nucleic acid-binding protein
MELLGFHRITQEEETLIKQKLEKFSYLPLTKDIENRVVALRQSRKIKLPDAIIAATALSLDIELLTLDQHLLTIVCSRNKAERL